MGADSSDVVDTRVIAATNTDLTSAARQGTFRKDLLYRLDYLRLPIPPLRERGEDIAVLAKHFLGSIAGDRLEFSAQALAAIMAHSWPGNVRELRNRVEAAALTAEGSLISPEALELAPSSALTAGAQPAPEGASKLSGRLWDLVQDAGMSLSEAVAFCETLIIQEALVREGNNRTRAAHRLGIHVRTIFKKLGPSPRLPGTGAPREP